MPGLVVGPVGLLGPDGPARPVGLIVGPMGLERPVGPVVGPDGLVEPLSLMGPVGLEGQMGPVGLCGPSAGFVPWGVGLGVILGGFDLGAGSGLDPGVSSTVSDLAATNQRRGVDLPPAGWMKKTDAPSSGSTVSQGGGPEGDSHWQQKTGEK